MKKVERFAPGTKAQFYSETVEVTPNGPRDRIKELRTGVVVGYFGNAYLLSDGAELQGTPPTFESEEWSAWYQTNKDHVAWASAKLIATPKNSRLKKFKAVLHYEERNSTPDKLWESLHLMETVFTGFYVDPHLRQFVVRVTKRTSAIGRYLGYVVILSIVRIALGAFERLFRTAHEVYMRQQAMKKLKQDIRYWTEMGYLGSRASTKATEIKGELKTAEEALEQKKKELYEASGISIAFLLSLFSAGLSVYTLLTSKVHP